MNIVESVFFEDFFYFCCPIRSI